MRLHRSVDEFRTIAEPLYQGDPVLHTIELTVLQSGSIPDDSLLVTVWDDGVLVGAALQTPPYPLSCTGIPLRAVSAVVAEVYSTRPGLTGVRGVRETTLAFAETWRAVTGRPGEVTVVERLYRLGRLRAPDDVAGAAREAVGDDCELLVDWVELFFGETFGHPRDGATGDAFVEAAKAKGDRFILWVVESDPVSMAMVRASAAGVSRIGPVFTPTDRRGHGYGSAVTAAAADLAVSRGVDDVVLFADLANPVSNAIYQRIGFEPVADSVRIDFVAVD